MPWCMENVADVVLWSECVRNSHDVEGYNGGFFPGQLSKRLIWSSAALHDL